eukprot:CAMPEP_0116853034 /NCGR_PEP_ID=MMETSP0418-20121206/17659_1 /TAXON_ID=1158023 /ORGANISM="Astrosyne radiata, Strain 13vi08-1A" /LENGTH=604 /DNA_ID=CAMNT_0004485333 /DNA_START=293 /DNA_END=2107 /DNA_ORIENTATION=+
MEKRAVHLKWRLILVLHLIVAMVVAAVAVGWIFGTQETTEASRGNEEQTDDGYFSDNSNTVAKMSPMETPRSPFPTSINEDVFLQENQTWTSSIGIMASLIIPEGKRLVIEEGTRVVFGSLDSTLVIHGELHVLGSPDHPVIMEVAAASWNGIEFSHTAIGGKTAPYLDSETFPVYSGGSILKNIELHRVSNGLHALHDNAPYIDGLVFVNPIINTGLLNVVGNNIFARNVTSHRGQTTVSFRCDATSSSGGRVWLQEWDTSGVSVNMTLFERVVIHNCTVREASIHIQRCGHGTLSNNTLEDTGLVMDDVDYVSLKHNHISGTPLHSSWAISISSLGPRVVIEHNEITNWNQVGVPGISISFQPHAPEVFLFQHNLFANITAHSVVQFRISNTSSTGCVRFNRFEGTMHLQGFLENEMISVVHIIEWPPLGYHLSQNVFNVNLVGNNATLVAWDHTAPSLNLADEMQLDATMNFWGSNDLEEIQAMIYDGMDSTGVPVMAFQPFLTGPDFSSMLSNATTNTPTAPSASSVPSFVPSIEPSLDVGLETSMFTTKNDNIFASRVDRVSQLVHHPSQRLRRTQKQRQIALFLEMKSSTKETHESLG